MDGHAHQESPASLIDEVAGLGTENHTRCKTAGGHCMMVYTTQSFASDDRENETPSWHAATQI